MASFSRKAKRKKTGRWCKGSKKGGFSTYLTGIPWSEGFMRQYAAALEGVKGQASNIGSGRIVVGTVNALVSAYLDPCSSSPFKIGAR